MGATHLGLSSWAVRGFFGINLGRLEDARRSAV